MVDQGALQRLVEEALARTPESRQRVFHDVSDLFLETEQGMSSAERQIVFDILGTLVHEIEAALRSDLARRLAELPDVPHSLIVTLANMAIPIAGPILSRSAVLRDPDLIEIALSRTREHRLAIASREQISEALATVLVDQGEADVITALLRNPDVPLAERTRDYLVAESRRVESFQEPLLRRSDLPQALAHRMFWWVSGPLRSYILENCAVAAGKLDEQLVGSVASLVEARPLSTVETEAFRLVERLESLGELNERFLVQALRGGRIPVFIAGLARLARLNTSTTRRVVFDSNGEPLALACRAVRFERRTFATIFLLTHHSGHGMRPEQFEYVLDLYERIDVARAKMIVKSWREDAAFIAEMSGVA